MTHILMLTTFFPPINQVASLRAYAFAKYLDKEKFGVTVITKGEEFNCGKRVEVEGIEVIRLSDAGWLRRPVFRENDPKMIHMLKVAQNILMHKLVIDTCPAWTERAFHCAEKIISRNNVKVVISSYGPIAPHLVALRLKARYPQLKWIADMRDELPTNSNLPFTERTLNPFYWKVQNKIMKYADVLTSVSEPILDDFRRLPHNERMLFAEIKNGFDFNMLTTPKRKINEVFTVVYAGGLHGGRDPYPFLQACSELVGEYNIDIRCLFLGIGKRLRIPLALQDRVHVKPRVPYELAIDILKSADILLLLIPMTKRRGVYTGKLFDYLGVLRPILALVPEHDVAAELIRRCRSGLIADMKNRRTIKECLLTLYNLWKNEEPFTPDVDLIQSLHRKNQVKKLEQIICGLLGIN